MLKLVSAILVLHLNSEGLVNDSALINYGERSALLAARMLQQLGLLVEVIRQTQFPYLFIKLGEFLWSLLILAS